MATFAELTIHSSIVPRTPYSLAMQPQPCHLASKLVFCAAGIDNAQMQVDATNKHIVHVVEYVQCSQQEVCSYVIRTTNTLHMLSHVVPQAEEEYWKA